ncbi:MAG: hypothetical protein HYW23_02845 [Candidatus Aenigmarchaeota archaeon]|nr:hypothetical protein [Candidatus Aenigmarchaeota archaeon]
MDKDIQAYFKMERGLIRKHRGKYAVFYNGKPVAIEKKLDVALEKAKKKTGAREFFVHLLYPLEEQTNAIV